MYTVTMDPSFFVCQKLEKFVNILADLSERKQDLELPAKPPLPPADADAGPSIRKAALFGLFLLSSGRLPAIGPREKTDLVES